MDEERPGRLRSTVGVVEFRGWWIEKKSAKHNHAGTFEESAVYKGGITIEDT